MNALTKNELFVFEEDGRILATARINQEQVPEYANCQWAYDAPARALYKKLGYAEQGVTSCVFNGIDASQPVYLEKKL